VIDKKTEDAIAYIMPNETGNTSYKSHKITLADLTKIIGVDLIPDAPSNVKLMYINAPGRTLN
jgi:hypothetical protein